MIICRLQRSHALANPHERSSRFSSAFINITITTSSKEIKFKHCALSSIPSFITHPYRTVQYTTVRAGFTSPALSSPASIIIDEAFQWYNLASPSLSNPIPSHLFPTKTLSPLSRVSQCQHTHCRHPLAPSSAAPCRYIAQPPSTHRTRRK